jgi:hypothetical protein
MNHRAMIAASALLCAIAASAPVHAEAQVEYQITIDMTWSEETHSADWPTEPHFSPWTGGVHKSTATFWDPGYLASPGVKDVAELGDHTTFEAEILAEAALGNASSNTIFIPGLNFSPGVRTGSFTLDRVFPRLTLITMVAPSPDWFTGATGLRLYRYGRWLNNFSVPIYPFDAGTDSGVSYESPDLATVPPDPISRIYDDPLGVGGTSPPVGFYRFEVLTVDGLAPHIDWDGDGLNNLREAELGTNLTHHDTDSDTIWDRNDNCPVHMNFDQLDGDGDGAGDACDNCNSDPNEYQSDWDADGEGDLCDPDDRLVAFTGMLPSSQQWESDSNFNTYNLYRGDLAVLRNTSQYSQDPSTAAADRFCGLTGTMENDPYTPPVGEAVFYLVSGDDGVEESTLGEDSLGHNRVNAHPCL